MTEAPTTITAQAQTSPVFRSDFDLHRELPATLAGLEKISRNYYWAWNYRATSLFRDLDPQLWDECEQDPRLLLKKVRNFRLRQAAADPIYLERLRAAEDEADRYLASSVPAATARIAYFCAEYGVHNSLPNYSGGLGILAGDHLKSASDLGLPLVAIGLLYRFGYFRQSINHEGWQLETYNDVFESELALTPVLSATGERVAVSVHIRGREVVAQAWLAKIGRISLYLLDTNLPQNGDVDRLITGHLYGGDTETRIVQEKVLGIGGVRLLRKLGVAPDVYHLNEGHAAFSTLELAHEYLAAHPDGSFADAAAEVARSCVFTTHTPVSAGNDAFDPALLIECFSKEYIASLKLTDKEFLALGRADLTDDGEFFGMTPLAIRMCRSSNGVSRKHGEVSRGLWQKMFPAAMNLTDVPITSVTNGVHPLTWIASIYQDLYERRLGNEWIGATRDAGAWSKALDAIPDADIWDAHHTLKELLVAFIRNRTRVTDAGSHETINEHTDTLNLFDPAYLTIGFARRVAAYKRWDLLFSDLDRLLRLVDDPERPVQFVFAGKAHPQDRTAKSILQKLMSINHDSNWQRRAVFIEDYDQEVARYLVRGVDVWLNVPRRPMEASGTSGMKAAMNGVLNASILDGWWIEGFDDTNGFAIGGDSLMLDEEMDAADAASLYETIEDRIVPAYYSVDAEGLRRDWIRMMRSSIATLTPAFSSDRMVRDYLTEIYQIT
ncbi:MAG: alpha-glucan family phosphorylase [Acidobacteria bacterium]|nr:alpha-glucan family phosphorylase [Acidobacteriota bacterium]MCW5949032.1 alpha-glucan family phosphorylase [Pyrinomonadaceae bacterium]